jgi:adenylate kinase family enzyme
MRIFVIGAEESGKSTAGRFLANALKLPVAETLDVSTRELARFCMTGEHTVQDEFMVHAAMDVMEDRFRKARRYFADLMIGLNPLVLIDRCMPMHQPGIIVGVSRLMELLALKQRDEAAFKSSFWIKIVRPGMKDEKFDLATMPGCRIIRNDGSLKTLKLRIEDCAREIRHAVQKQAA